MNIWHQIGAKRRRLLIVLVATLALGVFSRVVSPSLDRMMGEVARRSATFVSDVSQDLSLAYPGQKSPSSSQVLGVYEAFYPVVSVTDGDTFKVDQDGVVEKVRIVGIDTPETVDPRRSVECFGAEASAFTKSLLTGQKVRLEPDATQQDRDRYGRLLRFVFLEDGRDVGLTLIQAGMAQESLYSRTPHRYRDQYVAAQVVAKEKSAGLWKEGVCDGTR